MKNGGIIGPKNNISRGRATGRFSFDEQYINKRNQSWPSIPTLTYIGQYQNITDGTSFPITEINVGASGLIVFSVSTDVGTPTVTSLTANGISAIKVNEVSAQAASVSLWYLELPIGVSTTLSVTATTSATAARLILGVYRINDYSFAQPINQVSNTALGTATSVSLTTGSLQTNSILIAAYVNNNAATTTFIGVVEDFDTTTSENGSTHAGASLQIVNGGSVSVSATASAGGNLGLVTAAWR